MEIDLKKRQQEKLQELTKQVANSGSSSTFITPEDTQQPLDVDKIELVDQNWLIIQQWSIRTYALTVLFRLLMIIVWYFLQAFIVMIGPTGFSAYSL